MKKIITILLLIIFTLLIIFIITLPLLLSVMNKHIFTEIERVLLNVIIVLLSVFLGFRLSKLQDKSVRKWKAAVISACDNLIAMGVQTRSLKESQEKSRNKIEENIPDDNDPDMNNLRTILDMKYDSLAEYMDQLKLQIDTNIGHWKNVVDSLCDYPYSTQIHEAIEKKKQKFNV